MKKICIAIDGPSAAGKSTIAKILAKNLSYIYIDTGAMYRALTYKALRTNTDIFNEQALINLLNDTYIQLKPSDKGQVVLLDNVDVTEEIRENDVTSQVSYVSMHQLVRTEMVHRQQQFAEFGGIVMDGRDIGTEVLPNAEVKIFMIASVEERAERRYKENMVRGIESTVESLKEELVERDKLDTEREVSPLRKAVDAVELNTTGMSIDEVVKYVADIVSERIE